MNKIITAVVIVALASAAMGSAAQAGPGGGIILKPQQGGGGYPILQIPGKKGKTSGGAIASPGDAFIPGGNDVCHGTVKYEFDDAGLLQLVCYATN